VYSKSKKERKKGPPPTKTERQKQKRKIIRMNHDDDNNICIILIVFSFVFFQYVVSLVHDESCRVRVCSVVQSLCVRISTKKSNPLRECRNVNPEVVGSTQDSSKPSKNKKQELKSTWI